jgi:Xaa-Pro aminopeptidase
MTAAPPAPIALEEFRERQAALAADVAAEGLDGLLVWGQGGSTLDAYGHLFYLANHYPTTLRVNVDIPPYMTGWGNGALVLTADGDSTLVVESPAWERHGVVAEQVRQSWHLYREVPAALREAGLAEGGVGVAGEPYLPLGAWRTIVGELPRARFVPADELVFRRRMRKSAGEIAHLRHASAVGAAILRAMLELAQEGRREQELVAEGYRATCEHGATPG